MSNKFKRSFLIKTGHLLKEERIERNLSKTTVSKRTGIPVDIVNSIEGGYCKEWGSLVYLADYYGKRIRFILADGLPPEYSEEEEEA